MIKMENGLQSGSKRRYFRMGGKGGFTLVELMVVVSIVAILAAVATPAYINYVNRTKQGEAESMLMTARLEMEEYYTDNGQYASTIQCLPSFAANTLCLSDCTNAACLNSATEHYYTFTVAQVSTNPAYYQVLATRAINGQTDSLTISANTDTPIVKNTNALKFSIFKWLFGQ